MITKHIRTTYYKVVRGVTNSLSSCNLCQDPDLIVSYTPGKWAKPCKFALKYDYGLFVFSCYSSAHLFCKTYSGPGMSFQIWTCKIGKILPLPILYARYVDLRKLALLSKTPRERIVDKVVTFEPPTNSVCTDRVKLIERRK